MDSRTVGGGDWGVVERGRTVVVRGQTFVEGGRATVGGGWTVGGGGRAAVGIARTAGSIAHNECSAALPHRRGCRYHVPLCARSHARNAYAHGWAVAAALGFESTDDADSRHTDGTVTPEQPITSDNGGTQTELPTALRIPTIVSVALDKSSSHTAVRPSVVLSDTVNPNTEHDIVDPHTVHGIVNPLLDAPAQRSCGDGLCDEVMLETHSRVHGHTCASVHALHGLDM